MVSEAPALPGLRSLTHAPRDVCFLCCLQLAGRAHAQDWTSALQRSLESSCRRERSPGAERGARRRPGVRQGWVRPAESWSAPAPAQGLQSPDPAFSSLLRVAFWTPRGSRGWPPLSDPSSLLPGGLSRSDQGLGALPAGRPSCQSLMFPAMINLINNKYINLVFQTRTNSYQQGGTRPLLQLPVELGLII